MKISMIGAGQQGASQGLAFALLPSVTEVVFYDTDLDAPAILAKAQAYGIDPLKIRFADSIREAQRGAAITALNVPMDAFERVSYEVARYSEPGSILYDNGSGKTQADKDVQAGLSHAAREGAEVPTYVPAHFFVGRAGTGPQLADVGMYQGATAVLIPDAHNARAVDVLKSLFKQIGVRNIRTDLSAQDHDESLGFYSHHNTFFQGSLMRAFSDKEIAGRPVDIGSFLSSTRVAETGKDGVSMWGPIAVDNGDAIVSAGDIIISQLKLLDTALDDPITLRTLLGQAHDYTLRISESRPAGTLENDLYDLSRQESPSLPSSGTYKENISDTMKPYVATHVAMPVVFAAASVLGAMEYESQGGQPFSSIANSSFFGTIRPLRNSVDAMADLLQDNKQAVREALRHLTNTHQAVLEGIRLQNMKVVETCLTDAQNLRSRLPRERFPFSKPLSFNIS